MCLMGNGETRDGTRLAEMSKNGLFKGVVCCSTAIMQKVNTGKTFWEVSKS